MLIFIFYETFKGKGRCFRSFWFLLTYYKLLLSSILLGIRSFWLKKISFSPLKVHHFLTSLSTISFWWLKSFSAFCWILSFSLSNWYFSQFLPWFESSFLSWTQAFPLQCLLMLYFPFRVSFSISLAPNCLYFLKDLMAWYHSLVYFDIFYYIHSSHSCNTFICRHLPMFLSISSSLVSSVEKNLPGCRARESNCLTASRLRRTTIWATSRLLPLLSATGCHTRLDGQHCSLRTYHGGFFSRAEKPSEDITQRLFLMNMKGLIKDQHGIAKRLCQWVRRIHPNILLEW